MVKKMELSFSQRRCKVCTGPLSGSRELRRLLAEKLAAFWTKPWTKDHLMGEDEP